MTSVTAAPSIIEARTVSRVFGTGGRAVHALRDVSVDIARGAFTAIMGPSGSGKSTLMHVIAGLDKPTGGSILLDGTDVTTLDDDALTVLRRRRIGFVFQSFNLVPTLDVLGNIRLPFELDGVRPDAQAERWISALVDRLGLRDRLQHRPHQLSGGQQQRVAIARALATRPAVIVADEPTGNLDSRSGREVLRILSDAVSEWGQSVVMVTHDPVAASVADRILFLADGRIVGDRTASSAQEISSIMLAMEDAA